MAFALNGLENPAETGRGPNPHSEIVIFHSGAFGKLCFPEGYYPEILRNYMGA